MASRRKKPRRRGLVRIESLLRRERISREQWADEAVMDRAQFSRYLHGRSFPRALILARLVWAARRIAGIHVMASDLYDLGEEEPVSLAPKSGSTSRSNYDTRLDRYLRQNGISPAKLARHSGVARPLLNRKRTGEQQPTVGVIRRLVRALRQMGYDARASDLFDVGEDF
jgi:transcriptional regulator with XRE-family HTH domain